jgi:DNA-binding XRE family transcriptional regulator
MAVCRGFAEVSSGCCQLSVVQSAAVLKLSGVASYESERKAMLTRFAANLRILREERFPVQEEFASATNLHRAHIYMLEHGQREPEFATLLILAQTLDVPLDRLAEGVPVPKTRRSDRERKNRHA